MLKLNKFKIVLILIIFVSITCTIPFKHIKIGYAQIDSKFYAQVQKQNVYMYKNTYGSPLFEIPETFYVKLLENSKDGYYKAEYMGLTGYVIESDIQCVSNQPTTPNLLNVSFRNYGAQSSELRSEPTRIGGTSTLIAELPLYETNFEYIGKISGEEVVPNRGDTWYYCKYTKNNQIKVGYIYAGLIDMFSNYYSNPLDSYPILKHNWKTETSETTTGSIALPSSRDSLVILGISIPIIILLIALFKPANNNKKYETKKKKLDLMPSFEEPRYTSYNIKNANNTKIYKLNNTRKYESKINKHKRHKDYYEL